MSIKTSSTRKKIRENMRRGTWLYKKRKYIAEYENIGGHSGT